MPGTEIYTKHNYLLSHSPLQGSPSYAKASNKRGSLAPPYFNLDIDVFRELLDYLDPIGQLCLSATCKPFFDLLWPLMQKWAGWNNCAQSWRKHTQEIHYDENRFLLRYFSWSMCSLGGSGIIFPECLYRRLYGTEVINDQVQRIMDREATLCKLRNRIPMFSIHIHGAAVQRA